MEGMVVGGELELGGHQVARGGSVAQRSHRLQALGQVMRLDTQLADSKGAAQYCGTRRQE